MSHCCLPQLIPKIWILSSILMNSITIYTKILQKRLSRFGSKLFAITITCYVIQKIVKFLYMRFLE